MPYSFSAVDDGVLFIWTSMDDAEESYWYVRSLEGFFLQTYKHSFLEGCATLHYVVSLARTEF